MAEMRSKMRTVEVTMVSGHALYSESGGVGGDGRGEDIVRENARRSRQGCVGEWADSAMGGATFHASGDHYVFSSQASTAVSRFNGRPSGWRGGRSQPDTRPSGCARLVIHSCRLAAVFRVEAHGAEGVFTVAVIA